MQESRLKEIFSGKVNIDAFLREDPVHILSLVRFSAEEGQALTAPILSAMERAKGPMVLGKEAGEEFERIIMSPDPSKIRFLQMTGTLGRFLPELSACFELPQRNPHHIFMVGEHTLRVLEKAPLVRALRWAALLHDTGKSRTHTTDMFGIDHFHGHEAASERIAERVLGRFEVRDRETILMLISYHDAEIHSAKEWVEKIGYENFLLLLKLKKADLAAKSPHLYENAITELEKLRIEAEKRLEL